MTDNTLDAAILVAQERVYNNQERVVDPLDRTYARALIAELLRGMEPPEWFTTDEDCGYNAALTEVRRRAGLEVES